MQARFSSGLFVVLFLLLAGACKKTALDYRNKYVGDFNFIYSYSTWDINQGVYASDTIYYSGEILYDKKTDDLIKFNCAGNLTVELQINKDGQLFLGCGTNVGRFDNSDNVSIGFSSNSCPGGGLGGGTNTKILGTRK